MDNIFEKYGWDKKDFKLMMEDGVDRLILRRKDVEDL